MCNLKMYETDEFNNPFHLPMNYNKFKDTLKYKSND